MTIQEGIVKGERGMQRYWRTVSRQKMADKCDDYFRLAVDTVQSTGRILAEGFVKTKTVNTKSSKSDLVTEYDKRIEDVFIQEISKKYPAHKFIGEETKSTETLTEAPTWIIDPIDGTNNFVHGDENCAISVALAINKQLEIGIVYSPVKEQLFTAQRGKGAFLNGKPISVSKVEDINKSLLGFEVSLASSPRLKEKVCKRFLAIVSESHGVRSIGTCALSLCYVALGAWDAYQVDYLQPWDYSAGALIVQEAGGTLISTDGSPFEIMKRQVLVASSKQLAHKLVDLFKKADSQS